MRELTRYQSPKCIDLVEIDELVIEVCRKYLPKTACRLDDPRVHIHIADGLKFIRSCENKYDLIIVDSTDPFGPGEGLFTKEFYGSCYNALREDGIMVNQHESPFYAADAAAMVLSGQWNKKGVYTTDEFDPDPYMQMLNEYGLPWVVEENPETVA